MVQIEAEGGTETETFGEAGGVYVHDHVDERFDLRGLCRWSRRSGEAVLRFSRMGSTRSKAAFSPAHIR